MKLPDVFKVRKKRWVDADGRRAKASTSGATQIVETSKDWYADLPFIESSRERIIRRKHGKKKPKGTRVRLCQNKRAAQKMLREMIEVAEKRAAGIVDPSDRAEEPLGEFG